MYKKGFKGRKGRKNNLGRMVKGARKARQYNRGAKMVNVVQVAKQVQRLRKEVRKNTEMKEISSDLVAGVVGQVNVNSTGTFGTFLNVLNLGAGVLDEQRIGTEVMLKGVHFRMQLQQQANCTYSTKYIIDVWRTHDFSGTIGNIRDTLYQPDSISGVIDYHSTLDKDFSKDQFQLVARKRITVSPDKYTGDRSVKELKFFLKQNQRCTWPNSASTSIPQNVRYIMFIRASVGNTGSTDSTLTTIAHLTAFSGANLRFVHTDYYVDN